MTTHRNDLALLAVAVVFTLIVAIAVVGGWISAGIGVPLVMVGLAFVTVGDW